MFKRSAAQLLFEAETNKLATAYYERLQQRFESLRASGESVDKARVARLGGKTLLVATESEHGMETFMFRVERRRVSATVLLPLDEFQSRTYNDGIVGQLDGVTVKLPRAVEVDMLLTFTGIHRTLGMPAPGMPYRAGLVQEIVVAPTVAVAQLSRIAPAPATMASSVPEQLNQGIVYG